MVKRASQTDAYSVRYNGKTAERCHVRKIGGYSWTSLFVDFMSYETEERRTTAPFEMANPSETL